MSFLVNTFPLCTHSTYNLYYYKAHPSIYMFVIASQTVRPNWLKCTEGTQGYPGVSYAKKKSKNFPFKKMFQVVYTNP
jgi:hypothetical protein